MNSRWLAATGCLVAALAMGAAACGGDDDDSGGGGEGGGAKTVKVYSSLPLQGASRPQTTALVDGVKLALEQAGGKAGDITVQYESLGGSGRRDRRVHRRVQLWRVGGLDPDPQ